MKVKYILIVLSLFLRYSHHFEFIYPVISLNLLTINTPATYTFTITRNYDTNLNQTPWQAEQVPAGSQIRINFPSQYLALSPQGQTVSCDLLIVNDALKTNSWSCTEEGTPGNKYILIVNAFDTNEAVKSMNIIISNILNPKPALTTASFQIEIGNDISSNVPGTATVTLQPDTFTSCAISFDPTTVNTNGKMIITVELKNQIKQGGYINLNFPPSLQWKDDILKDTPIAIQGTLVCALQNGQDFSFITQLECSGSSATQIVKITPKYSSTDNIITGTLQISISNLKSPPTTQPIDQIDITSISESDHSIDICTSNINGLTPKTMAMSLTPTASPFSVNKNGGLKISFTLADPIQKTDFFRIYFPSDSKVNYLFKSSSLLLVSQSPYDSTNKHLSFKQSSSARNYLEGEEHSITFVTYTAPPSTRETSQFRFAILTDNQFEKMESFDTLKAVEKKYVLSISADVKTVGIQSKYTLSTTLSDQLTSTGKIVIIVPNTLGFVSSPQCPTLTPSTKIKQNPLCNLVKNDDNTHTITLTAINLSSDPIGPEALQIHVTGLINYFSAIQIAGFKISTYYTEDDVDLVAIAEGGSVQLQPGVAQIKEIIVNKVNTGEKDVDYIFTISTNSGLIKQNSKLQIILPTTLGVSASLTCQLDIPPSTSEIIPCVFSDTKLSVQFQTNTVAALVDFKIKVSTLVNPALTSPLSFTMKTLDQEDNTIDQSLQAFIFENKLSARDYKVKSVTPKSLKNFQKTSYAFSLSIEMDKNQLQENTKCLVNFPAEITFESSNLKCMKADESAEIPCTITDNTVSIDVKNEIICSESLCPFSFVLTNINNYQSFKPTSSFTITTQNSNGQSYAFTDSGLTVTNSEAVVFSNLDFTFSNTKYGGQNTDLSIDVSILGTESQVIVIDFNGYGLQTPINLDCSASSISIDACSFEQANKIVTITATDKLPSNFILTIKNLIITPQPPTDSSTVHPYIPISSKTIDNYMVHSSPQTIKFSAFCVMPCATCKDDDQNYCLTCYPPKLYYEGKCLDECDPGTFESDPGISCSICSPECSECKNSADFCTACDPDNGTYLFVNKETSGSTCVDVCPSTTYLSIDKCLYCVDPCLQCQEAADKCTQCLGIYYSYTDISADVPSLSCISQCPASITIANDTTMSCQYCNSPCKLCETTITNCLECIQSYFFIPAALIDGELENQCQQKCRDGMISLDSISCVLCNSPCKTCINDQDQCLTCIENHYESSINEFKCVQTCEQFSFLNQTAKKCQLCSSIPSLNCFSCSSETTCLKCDDPDKISYVFFRPDDSCLQTVPPGYVNISGIAEQCTENCAECSVLTNNCTKCSGNFGLYLETVDSILTGSCLESCPSTFVNINNKCEACVDPCLQCQGAVDSCTQCIANKIAYNGSCINADECPIGTYPNLQSQECSACLSPCQACESSGICETCKTGSLNSQGQCVETCQKGFVPKIKKVEVDGEMLQTLVCSKCLSPCLECSNEDFHCTSCIAKYFFYPEVNRCFSQCPDKITVPEQDNLICRACQSPCKNCSASITNCLSCVQNHYLAYNQAKCVDKCGDGYYPTTGKCQICSNKCFTCKSETQCLSCSGDYYLFQKKCISECPITHAIKVDNICQKCPNLCLNCSSATSATESKCFTCQNPGILYNGTCLEKCPSNLILYLNQSSGRYRCLTDKQYAQINLGQSLTLDSLFPLPFSIVGAIVMVATFMSRLQFQGTYIIGIGYCLFGVLELGSLYYFIFGVYGLPTQKLAQTVDSQVTVLEYDQKIFIFGIVALGIIYGLNIIALISQTIYLLHDKCFVQWLHSIKTANDSDSDQQTKQSAKQCCTNYHSFVIISILSTLTMYKLKVLLFTGMFKFEGLSAILQSVQKFRIFNVFSFFGIIHQGLVMYIVAMIFLSGLQYEGNQLMFLALVDMIIITTISFILTLLSTKKDENYFDVIRAVYDKNRDQQQSLIDSEGNVKKPNSAARKIYVARNTQGIRPDMKGITAMDSKGKLNVQEEADEEINDSDQVVSFNVSEEENERNQQRKERELSIQQQAPNHNIINPNRGNKIVNTYWVEKSPQKSGRKAANKVIERNTKKKQDKMNRIREEASFQENDELEAQGNQKKSKLQKSRPPKANQTDNIEKVAKDNGPYPPSKPSSQYSNILYKKKSEIKKDNSGIRQSLNQQKEVRESKQLQSKQPDSMKNIQSNQLFKRTDRLNKTIKSSEVDAINAKDEPSFQQFLPFIHHEQKGQLIYVDKKMNKSKDMGIQKNIFDRSLRDQSETSKEEAGGREQEGQFQQIQLVQHKLVNKPKDLSKNQSNPITYEKDTSKKGQQEEERGVKEVDDKKQILKKQSGFIKHTQRPLNNQLQVISNPKQSIESVQDPNRSEILRQQQELEKIEFHPNNSKQESDGIQNETHRKQKKQQQDHDHALGLKKIEQEQQPEISDPKKPFDQQVYNDLKPNQRIQNIEPKIYRRKNSVDLNKSYEQDKEFDDKIAEKKSKLEGLRSNFRKQLNRKRSRQKLSKEKLERSFQITPKQQASSKRHDNTSLHSYQLQVDEPSLEQIPSAQQTSQKKTQNMIKKQESKKEEAKRQIQEEGSKKSKEVKQTIQLKKMETNKPSNQSIDRSSKNNDENMVQSIKNKQSFENKSRKSQHSELPQRQLSNKNKPNQSGSDKKLELSQQEQSQQEEQSHKRDISIKQSIKQKNGGINVVHEVVGNRSEEVRDELSQRNEQSKKGSEKAAKISQQFSQKILENHQSEAEKNEVKQQAKPSRYINDLSLELKKSLDLKKSLEKTHKNPMFMLEESSLALRKSAFNESSKYSNPFDLYNIEDQSKKENDDLKLRSEQSDEANKDDEQLITSHEPNIIKSQIASQMPIINYTHEIPGPFINKITEENSQTNSLYQDDEQIPKTIHKPVVEKNDDLINAIQIRPQNRQRKRIPKEDRDQDLHVRGLQPKIFSEDQPRSQDKLQRRSPTKYPLQKKNRSPEKNKGSSSDQIQNQNRPQRQRRANQIAQITKNTQKVVNPQLYATSSQPQFVKTHKFDYEEELDRNVGFNQVQFQNTHQLEQWKKQFGGKSSEDHEHYHEEMQIPDKPYIYQGRQSKEKNKHYRYEETEKTFPKGKLFEFEEVDQPMRGSTSKSGSKSKRRSSSRKESRKEPRNSLEKIYMQKISKK